VRNVSAVLTFVTKFVLTKFAAPNSVAPTPVARRQKSWRGPRRDWHSWHGITTNGLCPIALLWAQQP
jgi:hypothetical protein